MTDTRPITLGGRTFDVPALPLRINMKAYPLCQKLSNGGLIDRMQSAQGKYVYTEEDMSDLVEIAFLGASAADPELTRDAFENLPVGPGELYSALLVMRYQTGGWVPVDAQEGQEDEGEAQGAETPPTSISEESSPS